MDTNGIVAWYRKQFHNKQTKIQTIKDLSTANIFLQLIHNYHPKIVDLTRVYFKPKNHFEVLQNYKQLLAAFGKLGWKKFDPDKYAHQKEKDYTQMGSYIMKVLTDFRRNSKNNIELEVKDKMEISKKGRTFNIEKKGSKELSKIEKLEEKKQLLLNKIMSIEHVMKEAQDAESAKSLVKKILQQ